MATAPWLRLVRPKYRLQVGALTTTKNSYRLQVRSPQQQKSDPQAVAIGPGHLQHQNPQQTTDNHPTLTTGINLIPTTNKPIPAQALAFGLEVCAVVAAPFATCSTPAVVLLASSVVAMRGIDTYVTAMLFRIAARRHALKT